MTSLAKQLQRLAVPHAQAVLGEDKKKASLLFDPKEAASIDRETFYSLGLNGLEELETLDSSFLEFESNLFGESSLSFERSVQSKDVNQKLSATIKRFLIRVSPYCLLKPAHKAIEWLIQRFHIHFYNIDELMMCFMPYHESNIFARALQLIRFDSKVATKWDFLEPLQKSGLPLSRKTLMNHCATDVSFLSFICGMVPQAVEVMSETGDSSKCRVLYSFYATTVIGVLDSTDMTETLLSALLLHLTTGMKSTANEYKAATYMILAQLLHKAKLKSDLLKSLQNILAKSMVQDVLTEAVSCLILMFQTQDMSSVGITKKSFKYMCKHYSVTDIIARLHEQFEAKAFLGFFLDRLIPAAFKNAVGIATSGESSESDSSRVLDEYMSMLHRLLSSVSLPSDVAEEAAYNFLQVYIRHGNKYLEDDVNDRIKESLQGIVRQLEGKHSDAVDRAVNRTLKECEKTESKNLVQEFLNLYVLSVPHQLVADSETSLVLSLNHRLSSVRQKAVKMMVENKHAMEDDFLKDSLVLRLKDDDPAVVLSALSIGQDLWSIIDNDIETVKLLKKSILNGLCHKEWMNQAKSAVDILGSYHGNNNIQVFSSCLPCCFLPQVSTFNYNIVNTLLTSSLMSRNSVLMKVKQEWTKISKTVTGNEKNLSKVNENIAKCLAGGLHLDIKNEDFNIVQDWTKLGAKGDNSNISCLMMMVLDNLVSMVTDLSLRLKVCLLQTQLVSSLQTPEMYQDLTQDYKDKQWSMLMKDVKLKNGVPQSFLIKSLHSVAKVMNIPQKLDEVFMWQVGNDEDSDVFLRFSVTLYKLILDNVSLKGHIGNIYRNLLHLIQTTFFKDTKNYLKFLCLLWTQHSNDLASDLGIDVTLQARSLHLGLTIIQNLPESMILYILQSTPIVSSILIVLTSELTPIRNVGISYVKYLEGKAKALGSVFVNLLKKIRRCEGEILADSMFIKEVIASLFQSTHLESVNITSLTISVNQSGTPKSKKEGKQSALAAILDLIVCQSTPAYIQSSLLDIFSLLNTQDVLNRLLPLMEALIKQTMTSSMATRCLNYILKRFTVDTSDCLRDQSTGLKLFIKCMTLHEKPEEGVDSPQITVISQITKEFYSMLDGGSQMDILCCLFDVGVDTRYIAVADLVRKTLKHLSLDGKHVERELKKCIKLSTATTVREAKKLRVQTPGKGEAKDTEFDSRDWQRVNVVFEAIHNKKKIQNYTVLVPVCFQILSSILESDNHVSAEYLKQLVLSLIHNICVRLDKLDEGGSVPEQQFNMDLIINCIRSSDNPQTHHHALLLLTAAAKLYPEHLLHNMMSVFTFMGANIMRQDDAYSFLIISKILETVVPALITACEQRKRVPKDITNDPDDIITMVIQVFVDSYPHIPQHRRLVLFNKLLTVIGVERYLWRTLLLMMKHVVTKGTLRAELTSDSQEVSNDTEFCLSMCLEFSSVIQLSSATEMLEYLLKLPDDKDDESRIQQKVPESFGKLHKEDAMIFNVACHTGKQLRLFKYAAINLLVNLYTNSDFIYQITVDGENELVPCFESVLESSLKLVSHVTKVTNRSVGKSTVKYWKAFQHKAHDMLDKFVSLLPDDMFIAVIGGLLKHDLPTVQRKAMDLLNTKLQQQKDSDSFDTSTLSPMIDMLRKIVRKLCLGKEINEEMSVNSQTAFISLKLLCRYLGLNNKDQFVMVLRTSVDVFNHKQTNIQVAACALLCIAEIVSVFKHHVIEQLSTFMSVLVAVMADTDKLYSNELYLMSVITTVNKVVENLAKFLSPYLHNILLNVCLLSTEDIEILQKQQVQLRLKAIRSTLSNSLPTRVLLPIVQSCHEELVKTNLPSVSTLMSLFGDHVSHITREDLTSHMVLLQKFFIQCLDIRTDYPSFSEEELNSLESVTIETIITMVMKLSESTFKPFLFKVFDWATTYEEYRDRILVFYKLADRLAEKLRSLFTLFAAHIMDHAVKLLDLNNSIKNDEKYFPTDSSSYQKSCLLLEYIFDCIYKCCLYDTDKFINRKRFDLLMNPIVDQLENQQGDIDVYRNRINDHLVPCLVQLCVAAQDDSLWRSLNYQVCLKTRSENAEVKLSALVAIDQLNRKLGDDYMQLLPDTVPFLAELMEDDSEDVENKCHEVIREMEKTLGEPLQSYF
ncbi:HEAT repeat-containing protein 1 [Mactra antiquata]